MLKNRNPKYIFYKIDWDEYFSSKSKSKDLFKLDKTYIKDFYSDEEVIDYFLNLYESAYKNNENFFNKNTCRAGMATLRNIKNNMYNTNIQGIGKKIDNFLHNYVWEYEKTCFKIVDIETLKSCTYNVS